MSDENTTPGAAPVDITPQPTAPAADPLDAILSDPAKVERLLSHPAAVARLNAVVASHVSRIKPPAPQAPAPSEPKTPDGRLADLERTLAEERNARLALERQRHEETLDRRLEEALRAKGVRPELVPAAHAYLKSRSLRVGEDGTAKLVVTRARTAGQPASALEYDDLAQGVGDWLADPSAQAFLPPPAPLQQRQARPLAVNPLTGRPVLAAPTKAGGTAAADATLAELLGASGQRF